MGDRNGLGGVQKLPGRRLWSNKMQADGGVKCEAIPNERVQRTRLAKTCRREWGRRPMETLSWRARAYIMLGPQGVEGIPIGDLSVSN